MRRFVLIALGCLAGLVHAAPITYIEQVTATGTLGTFAFTNEVVTVRMVGDTANVVDLGGVFANSIGVFTVDVAGHTAVFTDAMRMLNNTGSGVAGFTDLTIGWWMLGTEDPVFKTYNLGTAIGPVSGTTSVDISMGFQTTAGSLVFEGAQSTSTFTAATDAVPEPVTTTLAGLGLAAILVRRRLRA